MWKVTFFFTTLEEKIIHLQNSAKGQAFLIHQILMHQGPNIWSKAESPDLLTPTNHIEIYVLV